MRLLESPSGWCESATRTRPTSTDALRKRPASRSADRLVPRWWVEVGLLVGLYFAYELTRGLQSASAVHAERTGWALLHWEQRWHLAVEAPLNAGLQNLPAIAVICGYFYATLHFVVTPAVLVFLYRRHPADYRQARTALGLATAAALIGYFLLPTAPPRLLLGGGFHDTMAAVSNWGWWGGEGSAPRGLGGLTNQVAAMPSLHVGWALWSGYCIARYARRPVVRILGAAYPLLTALVVMSTANHYLADALAGSLLVVLAWVVVARYGVARRPEPLGATAADAAIPAPRTGVLVRPREPVPIPLQTTRQEAERRTGSRNSVCSSR